MSVALSLADLEQYDAHAPCGGAERRFLCPRCGDDKPRDRVHRSLALNTRSGAWVCHRCNEKGLLKDFWTDRPTQTRCERAHAAVTRAFALPPKADRAEKREVATGADWREMWTASVPLDSTSGVAYVEGRGIPADVVHEAGVRFSATWYGRPSVLFPMHDKAGGLIAVNGRFVDGRDNPKTQTAGPKSLGLFVTPGALSAPLIAVCEGPMDALSLWLCGIAAVALVGTSWPDWLPSALAFKPALIATDADKSGDEAAAKLTSTLEARGTRTFRLRSRGSKDWNEALEKYGVEVLSTHLAAFSEAAGDEERINAAWQLMESGRADAARFIASLVEDAFTREALGISLRRRQEKGCAGMTTDADVQRLV